MNMTSCGFVRPTGPSENSQALLNILNYSTERLLFYGLWLVEQFLYLRPVLAFVYCCCLHLCVNPCVHPEFVCAIICNGFKPGSPNLDQKCKILWLRSLLFVFCCFFFLFLGCDWPWPSRSNLIEKVKISPPEKIHLPPEKIHNSHDYLYWLLHGPSLHPLHLLIYLGHFTVPSVSQSQPSVQYVYWGYFSI